MNRRGFLGSILAACVAPAIARVVPPVSALEVAKASLARVIAENAALEIGFYENVRFITRAVILNEAWMVGVEPPKPRRDRPAYRRMIGNRWER